MTETQNYKLRRYEVVFGCYVKELTFLIILSDYNKYHFKICIKNDLVHSYNVLIEFRLRFTLQIKLNLLSYVSC